MLGLHAVLTVQTEVYALVRPRIQDLLQTLTFATAVTSGKSFLMHLLYEMQNAQHFSNKHHLLDTLRHPSAVALATELQHGSVPFGICSFGLAHSHSAGSDDSVLPWTIESNFIIFTEIAIALCAGVDISCRDDWHFSLTVTALRTHHSGRSV